MDTIIYFLKIWKWKVLLVLHICLTNNFSAFNIADQYPGSCLRECKCYVNPHKMVLVADCAHASLTQIPKSLPKDTDRLNISGNNIWSIQSENLKSLNILSRLDLQNNKIRHIEENLLKYLSTHSKMFNLDISKNNLTFLPRYIESTSFLTYLNLLENRFECKCHNMWMTDWLIKNRDIEQDYNSVNCEMASGRSIPFVQLSDTDVTCPSMFSQFSKQIHHYQNILKKIIWHWIVYWCHNWCHHISDEFPCGYQCTCYTDIHSRALVADCSNLDLTEIPHNLPNYTDWLILSGNNISSLSQKTLRNPFLPYLTQLHISGNSLGNISNNFFDVFSNCLSRLSFLDISNNNLTTLPRNIQNISSLKNLRLAGNPFQCNCDNMWMKDFLNSSDIIEDSGNITCTLSLQEEILMIDMNSEDQDCPSPGIGPNIWKILGTILISNYSTANCHCQCQVAKKGIFMSAIILSAILIFVLLVLVIICCRWEAIKFWMFVQFGFQFNDQDEPVENLQEMDYEAFANYA